MAAQWIARQQLPATKPRTGVSARVSAGGAVQEQFPMPLRQADSFRGMMIGNKTLCRLVFSLNILYGLGTAPHNLQAQVPVGFASAPIFDEEFNETSLDTSIWSYRELGMRDLCDVDRNAVSVGEGFARIRIYTAPNARGKMTHYGGAISSQGSFLHTYGYWEAAIRFLYQPGMQTSFWIQSPTIGQIIGDPQQSGV